MNAKNRRLAMAWVLAVASVCVQAASAADDRIETRFQKRSSTVADRMRPVEPPEGSNP